MTPSTAIKFFGTEEPAGEMTVLKAGVLEASLDGGNLRYIRIGGKEALRGIAFLVRDKNWGTYNPQISNLQIQQNDGRFTVSYEAVCADDAQSFAYTARIEGRADCSLTFEADGEAQTDVDTNRTGFVVLHPLEGVVGAPVTVEHTDGRIVEGRFPELIDPACPIQDIRSLTHEIAPGTKVVCRMEGDAFEMEDHRNWMDASYKTYIRPLAKPWPYTIPKGEKLPQRVTVELDGPPPAAAAQGGSGAVEITIGAPIGRTMPGIGVAVAPEHAAAALSRADLLKGAGLSHLVCHFDPRKGHDAAAMQTYAELGRATGADLVLEAVVPCLDSNGAPSADLATLQRDMAAIAEAAKSVPFARVAVSPAADLKCTLPGSVFPPAPTWAELFAAAREAFPGVPVGGGMFSYFTELNRKRPPAKLLDFICHTGSPIVHAGDDISAMENLEALPSIFKSVTAFAGGKPYWVFPTAISMRDNPYGAVPAENPSNIRQAMNRVDPRDRGVLGAAWYAGYLAHAAQAPIAAVTLGAAVGPAGIVYAKQNHTQPWFDEAQPAVMPSYVVISGLAKAKGAAVCKTTSSQPAVVQALALGDGENRTLWVANLTNAPLSVSCPDLPGASQATVLSEATFEAACTEPSALPVQAVSSARLDLPAYAVAMIKPA